MGIRYIKGMSRAAWQRIRAARQRMPFRSLADFVKRARLDEGMQSRLAEAGAFAAFAGNRRDVLWQVRGYQRQRDDALDLPAAEAPPRFADLDALERVMWDYETSRHSARSHPLEPLRAALRQQDLPDARTVQRMRDGKRVSYAGIVICRQRPATASGVMFMTLEDETGFVNVVLWKQVFEQYSALAKTVSFLGISGRLQVEQGIVHLIAESLWVPRVSRPPAEPSRNFR